jgi:lipoprotein-releasing system ATP-binding protein
VTDEQEVAKPLAPVTPLRHERGARLEVRKLGKAYMHNGQALEVLSNVDLSLRPGDMVAVVGASGVGKSTLLQILGTLDLPTSGSINFDGEELTRMGASRLAEFRNRRIGFVFQFHHLLPEFTAIENVMMPALIQQIPVAKARVMAKDILGRVGLSHRLTHRPSELSGGEQQRVALARAMVLGPSLLLADEPTGNLDRATGQAIHQLFLELNQERGSTLLVVTHNPELAALMPRQMRMIDGGRLIEETATTYRGTHGEEHLAEHVEAAAKEAEAIAKQESAADPMKPGDGAAS